MIDQERDGDLEDEYVYSEEEEEMWEAMEAL